MQLRTHHKLALAGALGLSGIAIFDAITHGLTGHWSMFADDGEVPWVMAVGDLVHGLAYTGALAVLHTERRRIHANRAASIFGWLLFVAFVPLAIGFLLSSIPPARDTVLELGGVVIGVAFGLQFIAALGLGLSLVRHPETGVGSRVLLAFLPVVGVTVALAILAKDWAHPAYVETVVIIGTALLATSRRRGHAPLVASADSAVGATTSADAREGDVTLSAR